MILRNEFIILIGVFNDLPSNVTLKPTDHTEDKRSFDSDRFELNFWI